MGFYYPRRERDQLALTARGLIAEAHDMVNPAGNALASQTVYASLLGLRSGDTVTNIVVNVQVAGAGTVPTDVFFGLYSTAGTRLALTADVSADAGLTATGYQDFALTAPYQVTADDGYYVVALQNGSWGTTAVQLTRGPNNAPVVGALGASAAVAVQQTGQASLPASATWAVGAFPFWFGVS